MEHKFAKLNENGEISFPPINGTDGKQINYFVDAPRLIKDGYKPFVGAERPCDGKNYMVEYSENEKNIIQTWRELTPKEPINIEEPSEIKRERAYRLITDGYEAELLYKTRKGYPREILSALEAKIDETRLAIKNQFPDEDGDDA